MKNISRCFPIQDTIKLTVISKGKMQKLLDSLFSGVRIHSATTKADYIRWIWNSVALVLFQYLKMSEIYAWTLKAITCRGSTQLFKNKCASGIFCIRNSPEFLRIKTGISTGVSETRSQLWKDSQLKISVLMQRLFLLVARLVNSVKNLRPLLPNSKSSVDTSSISLLENGRIVPDTSASLNEYFTSPTINESVLTFSVDELSSHVSVVDIKMKAPRINFYFHPVSMARVSEILSNLNVRKPAGPDGIPPKPLKIAAPVIAGPMTKLFNYCTDVGE